MNASGIYLVGGDGPSMYRVIKSHDFGATWDTAAILPNPFSPSPFTHASVRAFGDSIIIAATYPGAVAYSYNNGATWGAYHNGVPFRCFISSPRVITGIDGLDAIWRSNDGGQTFTSQDTMPHRISQLFFLNENVGFLCGGNGMIYKTSNGGGNPSTSVSAASSAAYEIHLFPNPSNNSLTVATPFESGSLTIFNATGQRVMSAAIAGQSTTLAVSSLATGSYQIVVSRDGQVVATAQWLKR